MIKTEAGYKQTLELIKREKATLNNLKKEFPTLTGRKFAILENSAKASIKQMEDEARDYERRALRKAS